MKLTKAKFLKKEDYKAIEKLCLENLDDHKAVFILMGMYTGARLSEIRAITQDDIVDGSVTIRGLKSSNDRDIPLPDNLVKAFKKLSHKPFDVTVQSAMRWWRYYKPFACKQSFHSLRHTMALNLYRKTKDVRLVSYVLGHRSIQNTMVYASYAYAQEELKQALISSGAS